MKDFGGMSFTEYQKYLTQEQSPIDTEKTAASDLHTKQLFQRTLANDEYIKKALFLGLLDNQMIPNMPPLLQVAMLRSLR